MHIQVLVGTQAATEQHVVLALSQVAVRQQLLTVHGGVDRVVRLVALVREARVLAHDDGCVLGVVTLGVEVTELVDAGEGNISIRVVHHGATLEVLNRQDFFFQVDGTPGQVALSVVEVAVNRAGVDHGNLTQDVLARVLVTGLEEVSVQVHLNVRVRRHTLQPCCVAVNGQTLVLVVEVAVVVVVANRQAGNDRCGQLFRRGLPLLSGVVLDERLVQGATNQGDTLIVQVLRVGTSQLASLLSDERLCLCGRVSCVEELVDGTQVNRHGVHDAVVAGVHAVYVVGELGETVHVLPDTLVGGVEQVRTVAVHLNTGLLLLLAVCVTTDVGTAVQQGNLQAQLSGSLFCDGQTKEARTDYYEVSGQCFLLYYHGAPPLLRGRYSPTRLDTSEGSQSRRNPHGWVQKAPPVMDIVII